MRALFVSVLLGFLLTGCGEEPPVVIGAVLPLSGPAASAGEDIRDGLQLAIEEINADGGLDGRPLALRVANGAGDADAAPSAYRAVSETDPAPLLVVAGTSAVSMAMKPLAEQDQRLLFGLVATAPALTKDVDHVYRYWPTAEQELPVLTSVLPMDVKRVGVFYLDDAYGTSVFTQVKARLAEAETTVEGVPFPPNQAEFQSVVADADRMDAVAVIGFEGHIRGVLGALEARGYAGTRVSTTTATLPSIVADPAADNTNVVAPAIFNQNFVFAEEIRYRYEARFGRAFNQYAANGYDFVIMVSGLLEGQAVTIDNLRARLNEGFVYSGIFGNVSLSKGGHDIAFPLFPAQIRHGRIVYR